MATTRTSKTKPDAPKKPEPLLRIETLAPTRPFMTLDDVRHDFRLKQEFGAVEDAEFGRDSREYDTLYGGEEELADADKKRIEELLDELVERVLVDPGKLREQAGAALTGAIKREILLTFTNAPLLIAAMAQQTATEAGNRSTTAS